MKQNIQTQISPKKFRSLLKKKRPLKIGLTGGIGAGKSLALKVFEKKKIPILQTDLLGWQLLKNEKIKNRLVKAYSGIILDDKGEILREKLAQAAFNSPRGPRKLNSIMHPAIRRAVAGWIKEESLKPLPSQWVIVEVPLLFERGFYRSFDAIISISAMDSVRRKRLVQRGWSLTEIRHRERLQWPQERKNRKADWVIYNQKSEKDLKWTIYEWMALFQIRKFSHSRLEEPLD